MNYKCSICEWIYDERKENKPFSEQPSDWTCPMCGASKDMFEEIKE